MIPLRIPLPLENVLNQLGGDGERPPLLIPQFSILRQNSAPRIKMSQKPFLIKQGCRHHGMMFFRKSDAPVPVIVRIPFGSVKNKKDRPVGKTLRFVGKHLDSPISFAHTDLPFSLRSNSRRGEAHLNEMKDSKNEEEGKSHGIRTPFPQLQGGFSVGFQNSLPPPIG